MADSRETPMRKRRHDAEHDIIQFIEQKIQEDELPSSSSSRSSSVTVLSSSRPLLFGPTVTPRLLDDPCGDSRSFSSLSTASCHSVPSFASSSSFGGGSRSVHCPLGFSIENLDSSVSSSPSYLKPLSQPLSNEEKGYSIFFVPKRTEEGTLKFQKIEKPNCYFDPNPPKACSIYHSLDDQNGHNLRLYPGEGLAPFENCSIPQPQPKMLPPSITSTQNITSNSRLAPYCIQCNPPFSLVDTSPTSNVIYDSTSVTTVPPRSLSSFRSRSLSLPCLNTLSQYTVPSKAYSNSLSLSSDCQFFSLPFRPKAPPIPLSKSPFSITSASYSTSAPDVCFVYNPTFFCTRTCLFNSNHRPKKCSPSPYTSVPKVTSAYNSTSTSKFTSHSCIYNINHCCHSSYCPTHSNRKVSQLTSETPIVVPINPNVEAVTNQDPPYSILQISSESSENSETPILDQSVMSATPIHNYPPISRCISDQTSIVAAPTPVTVTPSSSCHPILKPIINPPSVVTPKPKRLKSSKTFPLVPSSETASLPIVVISHPSSSPQEPRSGELPKSNVSPSNILKPEGIETPILVTKPILPIVILKSPSRDVTSSSNNPTLYCPIPSRTQIEYEQTATAEQLMHPNTRSPVARPLNNIFFEQETAIEAQEREKKKKTFWSKLTKCIKGKNPYGEYSPLANNGERYERNIDVRCEHVCIKCQFVHAFKHPKRNISTWIFIIFIFILIVINIYRFFEKLKNKPPCKDWGESCWW